MSSRNVGLRTLAAAMLATPLFAVAAGTDAFRNGSSFYGQPGNDATRARVVDAAAVRYINVNYGDTVIFTNGSKRFTWTFDGLDVRAVGLGKIAPADFGGSSLVVYVGRDPSQRR